MPLTPLSPAKLSPAKKASYRLSRTSTASTSSKRSSLDSGYELSAYGDISLSEICFLPSAPSEVSQPRLRPKKSRSLKRPPPILVAKLNTAIQAEIEQACSIDTTTKPSVARVSTPIPPLSDIPDFPTPEDEFRELVDSLRHAKNTRERHTSTAAAAAAALLDRTVLSSSPGKRKGTYESRRGVAVSGMKSSSPTKSTFLSPPTDQSPNTPHTPDTTHTPITPNTPVSPKSPKSAQKPFRGNGPLPHRKPLPRWDLLDPELKDVYTYGKKYDKPKRNAKTKTKVVKSAKPA